MSHLKVHDVSDPVHLQESRQMLYTILLKGARKHVTRPPTHTLRVCHLVSAEEGTQHWVSYLQYSTWDLLKLLYTT